MVTKKETKKTETSEKLVKTTKVAGDDISTAGFAIAVASVFTNFFTLGLTAVVGLVLSIMGRVQTSKAGHPNSLALAGIIISACVMVLTFIAFSFFLIVFLMAGSELKSDLNCEDGSIASEIHCAEAGDKAPVRQFRYDQI